MEICSKESYNLYMNYIIIFTLSVALSFILTLAIIKIAKYFKIEDRPDDERKKHKARVPLLGGVAPFLAFFSVIFSLFYFDILSGAYFSKVSWLFIASTIIIVGGVLDDRYVLAPKYQIISPILAIFIVLFGGLRAEVITNPLGEIIELGFWAGLGISFFWLLIITYTTKILDGLDGLVGGIIPLGALTIFLFTTLTDFKEVEFSYIALVLAGVFFGFLILNFYPARIFLGEGGSLWAGFILGSLAILTGAKIAVTLMVMALPLIDLVAVVLRRIFIQKKSPFVGDRGHLHFILVDRGLSPRQVVFIFWVLAGTLGVVSIFLPSAIKIIVLSVTLFIYLWTEVFFFGK